MNFWTWADRNGQLILAIIFGVLAFLTTVVIFVAMIVTSESTRPSPRCVCSTPAEMLTK